MTREDWLELCLLSLHGELITELHRRGHPGGMQAGVPRLAMLPLSVLQEWERTIRHAIEAPEEWWGKAESGELEHWLQSLPLPLTDEAREALVDLEKVRRIESDLRLRVYRLRGVAGLDEAEEATG